MSRCPNCGYPVRGRPDYDDSVLRRDGTVAEGGEIVDPLDHPDDSVMGVLGEAQADFGPPTPWWKLW